MSWFGTQGTITRAASPARAVGASNGLAVALGGAGVPAGRSTRSPIRGARRRSRDPGASRYALLDRVRGSRRGELPPARAGRHTSPVRFVTDTARNPSSARPDGRPGVVIIASPSDLLAQLVAAGLLYSHVPTCQIDPSDLASVELEWHGNVVTIDGQPIGGLLWRALRSPARLGAGTPTDPRIIASWLAAASFPSMRAVNAYDPAAWRRGAGWSVWKDRLGNCGVPVQPLADGEPDPGGSRSLIVCGRVVNGPDTACVAAAAEALDASGVRLASVTSLADGRVADVDPQPQVSGSIEARRAAARIADYLAA